MVMPKGARVRKNESRMFIDSSFLLRCPHCEQHFHFDQENLVLRSCILCKLTKRLSDFKYPSDLSHRLICNSCHENRKGKHLIHNLNGLTHTIITCTACLQEGQSEAGAKVIFCSKGAFDSLDPVVMHKHQKSIFKGTGGTAAPKEEN